MKKFAVGESDFKKIISGNYYYVDKSLFIKDIIDRGETVILVPHPRRFGKTLNISMLGKGTGEKTNIVRHRDTGFPIEMLYRNL